MRRQIVAGNWKMNKTLQEGISLASQVNSMAEQEVGDALVIVAPPFIHLAEVSKVLTIVGLSAQNCSHEPGGAYTGEVSAGMIKSAGALYVIIGHSERRTYFKEDDELLNRKINMALDHELVPIFCCGEQLSEREAGKHRETVKAQLQKAVFPLGPDRFSRIIIAYEPVWAIGTGRNATPEQAQEMHAYIREQILSAYGNETAGKTSILYGGSCNPANAADLFRNPDVDGGLIGGASLKAEDFIAVVKALTSQSS